MNQFLLKTYSELVYPSQLLPPTLILLNEWILITIKGKDCLKYLQTQLTYDLTKLQEEYFAFSAHCNEHGKVIGILYIFKYENGIAYIIRKSIYKKQLFCLKKYSIFSNISISVEKEKIIFGFTGFNFLHELRKFSFLTIPKEIKDQSFFKKENIIGLYFSNPIPRIILVSSYKDFIRIKEKIKKKVTNYKKNNQWTSLDIESEFPIIDKINSEKFLPQSIKLDKIHGINFKKGCYIGQEIIARTEYKKTNKKSLYWLRGTSDYIPNIGDILKTKISKVLYNVGYILAVVSLKEKNELWIQAVIKNKFAKKEITFFYLENKGEFSIKF